MKASEYGKLSDLVDSDDVTELEKALHLGHHNGTALGLLLLDAVENGSKRCFRLLLGHEDAIKLGGPTALGAAAREGDIEIVQALLDADVDLSRPKWQFDADEDHAIRGAMLSMNPEIMEAICSAGAVEQADAGWINEAMEIGAESALRHELIHSVAHGRHFDQMFKKLDSLPESKSREMAAMMVPWVARKARGSSFAEPGWWALEKLLDLAPSADRVDDFGRTALAYVVWETQDRQDLDYSGLNEVRGAYREYLRSLGAKTAEELQAEKSSL